RCQGATPAAARSRRITATRSSASRRSLTRSPRTASTYDLRSKRGWTRIELRPIGCILVAGDDLSSLALKMLPVRRLAIAIAHDKDSPLRRDVRLPSFIATDHRRGNVGVAAE